MTTEQWPPGTRVMVTGHRDVRGAQALHVQDALTRILTSLRERYPEGLVGVSGMAVGADAEFNHACIHLSIPLVAALPVEEQDSRWPWHARERYADQLRRAHLAVNVWEDPRYTADSYAAKMHARNRWMLDHAAYGDGVIIGVWDGRRTGGTWAAVSEALRRGRKVLVIHPGTGDLRVEHPAKKIEAPDEWPWDDAPFDPAKFHNPYQPITLEDPGLTRPKGFYENALIQGGYLPGARTNMGRMNMGRMNMGRMTMNDADLTDSMRLMQWVNKNYRSGG